MKKIIFLSLALAAITQSVLAEPMGDLIRQIQTKVGYQYADYMNHEQIQQYMSYDLLARIGEMSPDCIAFFFMIFQVNPELATQKWQEMELKGAFSGGMNYNSDEENRMGPGTEPSAVEDRTDEGIYD